MTPRRSLIAGSVASLTTVTLLTATFSPAASAVDTATDGRIVADTFGRTVSTGWGSADLGGAWTTTGKAAFSVSGGEARAVVTSAGSDATASTAVATAVDTDLSGSVAVASRVTGGGTYVSLLGRRVALVGDYRTKLRFLSTGAVTASLVRVAAGDTTIAAAKTITPSVPAGAKVQVRMRLRGTTPTTVWAKVWVQGAPEPTSWLLQASDTTAGLQTAGSPGFNTYLSASATAVPADVRLGPILATTPRTVLTSSSPSTSLQRTDSRSFAFSANTPGSRFECRLDAATWSSCVSGVSYPGLADGSHNFQVRAVDSDGFVAPAALASWAVDTTAPTTTLTTGPADGSSTDSTSAVYQWTSSELATFGCSMDGTAWAACQSGFGLNGLTLGAHTFAVRGTDSAGNLGPAVTRTWTVIAPPIMSVSVASSHPDATSTGVPSGTVLKPYYGDLTITTAGTVVDGLDIHGFVNVQAPDVTIRRSIVRGGQADPNASNRSLITSTQPGVLIEDTELSPAYPSVRIDGLKGYGFTARRLNIHDAVDNVLIWGSHTTLTSSWLHDNRHYLIDPNQNGTPSHDDSLQVEGGDTITVTANTLTGAFNAAIMVTQNAALTSNLSIDHNWLGNGGCTVNVAEKNKGPLQNLVITNNRFYRTNRLDCAAILPTTTIATTTTNNVYDDNDQAVYIRRN